MPIERNWNRCDSCGRFVAFRDFDLGGAIRRMVTPDSEFSKETWETICGDCWHKAEYLKVEEPLNAE